MKSPIAFSRLKNLFQLCIQKPISSGACCRMAILPEVVSVLGKHVDVFNGQIGEKDRVGLYPYRLEVWKTC